MRKSCPKETSLKRHPAQGLSKKLLSLLAIATIAITPNLTPAHAQVETIDPNDAIDADLAAPDYDGTFEAPSSDPNIVEQAAAESDINADLVQPGDINASVTSDQALPAENSTENGDAIANVDDATTFQDDDLIGAAEGVFGKGAKGLAGVIEGILKKQGRPNAYIAGREASGAFVVGLRYGSGKLYHKIEGERPVYWTGPSIGFDVGGNAANSFVLVYNLYDTEDLYRRFPAGEGAAYFVGGFHVSYLRSGDKVLIPVRLGAGLRLGANVGYMKFSKKQKWLPF